jgi:hypothetical protein
LSSDKRSGLPAYTDGPNSGGGVRPVRKIRLADEVKLAAQPAQGASDLAPLPAWTTPRVRQDQGRSLAWTLLHLRLALRSTHLGLDFPECAVGAYVDITASKPHVTIPPVMLNSHMSNLGQIHEIGVEQSCEKFSPAGWSALSDPVVFGRVTCATVLVLGRSRSRHRG